MSCREPGTGSQTAIRSSDSVAATCKLRPVSRCLPVKIEVPSLAQSQVVTRVPSIKTTRPDDTSRDRERSRPGEPAPPTRPVDPSPVRS